MTDSQKVELFLDSWRRLETAAERLVKTKNGANPVVQLCRDARFARYREELDYCREVRNLLSHQAKLDGEYPVCPSDAVLTLLQQVLRQLENPPRLVDVMTPIDKLLRAAPDSRVLKTMRRMRELGISHVPVLQNKRVVGVFSTETIFQAVLDGRPTPEETTELKALADYLPIESHAEHAYRFVAKTMTAEEAEKLFSDAQGRTCKLRLLLVTASGRADRPLVGVVSPYDLLQL